MKRRSVACSYEERVREVEHSTFVPVVLVTSGGMGKAATSLYKRIADLLSEKTSESYSSVMAYIRYKISYALFRACITCMRCARRPRSNTSAADTSAVLAVAEVRIAHEIQRNPQNLNLPNSHTIHFNGPLAGRDVSNMMFLISPDVTSGALVQHFRWRLM